MCLSVQSVGVIFPCFIRRERLRSAGGNLFRRTLERGRMFAPKDFIRFLPKGQGATNMCSSVQSVGVISPSSASCVVARAIVVGLCCLCCC